MRLLSRVTGLCLLASAMLFSARAEAGPVFVSNPINLTAVAQREFRLDMRTLLTNVGTGNLQWQAGNTKPAWLEIRPAESLMIGTPVLADVGAKQFDLLVSDGEQGAFTRIVLTVIILPNWTENPLNLGIQRERELFTLDLKTKVNVPGGGAVTFSVKTPGTLPSWMTLTPAGILSGTPARKDVGVYGTNLFFVATTTSGGASEVKASGEVVKVVQGPKWMANPITLEDAREDFLYSRSVADFALNFEGPPFAPLTFRLVNGPAWVNVASTGLVSGTPGAMDVGPVTLKIEVASVIEGQTLTDVADFKFKVIHTNHTPVWANDPIQLPDAFHGVAYSQNLKAYVTDPDVSDTLTFAIVSGPAWATLTPQGVFTGTPAKADVGDREWIVSVTDGAFTPTTHIRVKVFKSNEPPTWIVKPTLLPNAREDFLYSEALAKYVTDPDMDPVTFSLVDGPGWATISGDGALTGTPGALDVGPNVLHIRVTDGISGHEVAEVRLTVEHTNHAPTWKQDPILYTINEEEAVQRNLAEIAGDKDPQDTLSFTKISGPTWGSVSTAGMFSGTAQIENEGDNEFVVRVTDNGGLFNDVRVIFKVLHVNHKPQWTMNPVKLPNGPERVEYFAKLAPFATDIDTTLLLSETLTFTKIAGPEWINVNPAGDVSGTPQRPNVGLNKFTARVTDAAGAFAEVEVQIIVDKVNRVPRWTQDPLLLTDAFEDVNYAFLLSQFVVDDDGDPLTFTKKSGPAWLATGANGALSGVPGKPDLGNYVAVFTVNDGEASVDVTANGRVLHTNHTPIVGTIPLVTMKERETREVDLKPFISDPDADPLTFVLVGTYDWVSITRDGRLTLSPLFAHIGDREIHFKVSDGQFAPEGIVKVKVLRDARPPIWLEKPITFTAPIKKAFTATLAGKAKDEDNIALTFVKKSGPAWLTVSANGALTGTPQKADLGPNNFVVTVRNDLLGVDNDVVITVFDPNQTPIWKQDPIVLPNAPERSVYTQNLSTYATDPDVGDTLTFSKVDGPAWATVALNGTFTGTPLRANLGLNVFTVRTTDQDGKFADVKVHVTVDFVNNPPVWTQKPLVLADAFEDKPYAFDIAKFAQDDDGDKLTFVKVEGPAWLITATDGKLSGTPSKPDLGNYKAVFRISDGRATTDVDANGRVLHTNHDPSWTKNPIVLPNAPERSLYTQNLSTYAIDPDDGDKLTFSKVDGPTWATVAANGTFTGTPLRANLGLNVFTVRVADQDGKFADVKVQVTVDFVNNPPVWTQKPIALADAFEDKVYAFDISRFAVDEDGDKLTFVKVDGPAWLSTALDGKLSGIPSKPDLGPYKAVFRISDGRSTADVDANGRVLHTNHTPTINPVISFTIKERETRTEDLAVYVNDPDGDKLTYSLSAASNWITLSADGKFTMKPLFANIGDQVIKFKATDGEFTPEGTITIKVLRDPRPPVWKQDPIRFTTKVELPFTANIAALAQDLDNLPLTFSKVSGPDWLTVDANGALSGTPQMPNVGENRFVVMAKNDLLGANTNVIIDVIIPNKPPVIGAINLTIKEREVRIENMNNFVTDPEGKPLAYSTVAGLDFATLAADGSLTLRPVFKDIGVHTMRFKASDGEFAPEGVITITVVRDPRAPQWLENPIRFTAKTHVPFVATLAGKAKDLDNLPLTFSKVDGPAWLSVAANGALTGTPVKADLGENTFTVLVRNDVLGAQAKLIITVELQNKAPRWTQSPIQLPDATEESAYTFSITNLAVDDDGDPLTFTKKSGPAWLALSTAGKLSGTPLRPDVGAYVAVFSVTDGFASVDVTANGRVLKINHPPIVNPTIALQIKEREIRTDQLKNFVTDADNDALTFSPLDNKDWISLASTGAITMKPLFKDIGDHTFRFRVTDGTATVDSVVTIKVIRDPRPPVWFENPIRLTAQATVPFTATIAGKARDLDGIPITFSKRSGPGWLTVGADGSLSGTPEMSDIGENSFIVVVANDLKTADTTLIITVKRPNTAPHWSKDPIPLGDIPIKKLFTFNLAQYAVDEDGDTLRFSIVSGPSWLFMNSAGLMTGTPQEKDLGEFVGMVEVNDAQGGSRASFFGRVIKPVNGAPVLKDLFFTMKAGETLNVNLNQALYVTDPEGDTMTFELTPSTTGWTTMTNVGFLTAKPKTPEVGEHFFTLKVTDSQGNVTEGPLVIKVLPEDIKPPVWAQNPIRFNATVNQNFLQNIGAMVSDPLGKPLTITKKSGPDWLMVSPNGALSGVPKNENLGENSFLVTASNGSSSSDVTVIITVKPAQDVVDSIQVDQAVPGAPSENLWVVNNYPGGHFKPDALASELKSKISVFYNALKNAGIKHTGVFITGDAQGKDGRPIQGTPGYLMKSTDTDVVADFKKRVDAADARKGCPSPLWAMFRFYEQAQNFPFYKNGYFTSTTPMDVMIVTRHKDYYKNFSANKPQSNWRAADFANDYIDFEKRQKQPYRISAIAPECGSDGGREVASRDDEEVLEPIPVSGENPYRVVVEKTKGEYYKLKCPIKVDEFLRDYADKVIFRAYVHAKNRLKLSQKPTTPSAIKLFLGGVQIPGNTGAQDDKWFYDASTNEVVIQWHLFDMSTVRPGDLIEIKYSAAR